MLIFLPICTSDDFEKMVMITCGVVITMVTCIGMCFEQYKKKIKKKKYLKLKNRDRNKFRIDDEIDKRF
jgi:hypothetical protein